MIFQFDKIFPCCGLVLILMIKTRFKRCNASFFVYSPIHTSRNGLVPSFENGLKFTEKLTLALSLLAGGSEFD